MRVQRLTIHRVGYEYFSRMEAWIDLAESEDDPVAIRTFRHNVVGERLAAKFVSEWCSHFGQQIEKANARVRFICVRVRIVHRHRDVRKRFQIILRYRDWFLIGIRQGQLVCRGRRQSACTLLSDPRRRGEERNAENNEAKFSGVPARSIARKTSDVSPIKTMRRAI